jgi:hypothetical protein
MLPCELYKSHYVNTCIPSLFHSKLQTSVMTVSLCKYSRIWQCLCKSVSWTNSIPSYLSYMSLHIWWFIPIVSNQTFYRKNIWTVKKHWNCPFSQTSSFHTACLGLMKYIHTTASKVGVHMVNQMLYFKLGMLKANQTHHLWPIIT